MTLPIFQSGFYLNLTQKFIFYHTQRTQTTKTIMVKEIVGICFKKRTKQYIYTQYMKQYISLMLQKVVHIFTLEP